MQSYPLAKELILVGGGHSHVIVLRMLGMNPIPGLQVTLISPDVITPYSGMLPGLVAGHYSEEDIHIDLVPLCRFAGARFIQASVTGIDPDQQTVRCEGRPDFYYDALSIDIGITPGLDVPGAEGQVIAVKPISTFLTRWQDFLVRMSEGHVSEVGFVGGGAGGVELCLAVQHRLRQEAGLNVNCWLFVDGPEFLQEFSAPLREKFVKVFRDRDITVRSGFQVEAVQDKCLISSTGEQQRLDEIFWVTSAAPQVWLKDTGLKLNESGFLAVRDTLQSENYDNVFAVGDVASVAAHPRPKAGVFAVRQGAPLFANLQRYLVGEVPKPFAPQRNFLSLISTGNKNAVGYRNGYTFAGAWVWRFKDWIDRRFMNRFARLPVMKQPVPPALLSGFDEQMQCGGCGSKVSADLLNEVLDELALVNIDNPIRDDAAIYRVPEGQVMLHSVDSFRSFIDDPYTFARIGVNHALSDIYAMGASPVTALAVITVPFATPRMTKGLLQQLLRGALDQLSEDGVALIGGHTSEGMELSLGFSVNGIGVEQALLSKAGMAPGEVLILTKPLGTGALFAADMQHRAQGEWIMKAIRQMQQSNRESSAVLLAHQASACTDITGFGLAGHLIEMARASNVSVSLDLDSLPLLAGADTVINALKITSTLHEDNRGSAQLAHRDHPAYELLFDPQTSGGLLASVSADKAAACVAALHLAGYTDAAIIGSVIEGPPMISCS